MASGHRAVAALTAAFLAFGNSLSAVHEPTLQSGPTNPLVGTWVADLSQSRLDPKLPLKAADLRVSVDRNTVTLMSAVVMPDGTKQEGTETLRTDGTETPGTLMPGIVHVANWVGSHVLAFIARKGDRNIALVTYQVSHDGQTLTARTSGMVDQVVVFRRR